MTTTADEVLGFWFEEIDPRFWFGKDEAFDQLLRQRFGELHRQACAAELAHWRDSAEGCLAEVILLDQFSRNLFRDDPRAFAQDGMALVLAQQAIHRQLAVELDVSRRQFLYMPFMHSESAVIHQQAVRLFSEPGLEDALAYELRHKEIIDRFGRYPHRDAILGRPSSDEALRFLQQPGSSF